MPPETLKRAHSDSAVQRGVEEKLRTALTLRLRLEEKLIAKRIACGTTYFEVDGYCTANGVIVLAEIFAHVGALKSAQKAKVLKDILKLVIAERGIKAADATKTVRKLLIFVDDAAARYCRGKSWATTACQEFGIEVHVEHLPSDERARIVEIQKLQNLLPSPDAETDEG